MLELAKPIPANLPVFLSLYQLFQMKQWTNFNLWLPAIHHNKKGNFPLTNHRKEDISENGG
jgi:hypothetical protein